MKETKTNKKNSVLPKVILAVVVIALIAALAVYSKTSRKKSAFTIAFQCIPESVSEQIVNAIKAKYVGSVGFIELKSDFVPSKKSLKDIDIIFTYAGARTDEMEKFAKAIPEKNITSAYTTAIAKSAKGNDKIYKLPILLDCISFETLKGTDKLYYLPIPETYDEAISEMEKAKSFTQYPLFAKGNDDQTMLSLISVYTESKYGSTVYKNLINVIKENKTLLNCMDINISNSSTPLTFKDILSEIKDLEKNGILAPNWISKTMDDEYFYMKEKRIYGNILLLSDHREIPLRTLANYNTTIFPKNESITDHGLIAPEIVMISFTDRKISNSIITYFSNGDVQDVLSNISGLAPTTSAGGSYDTIADDVRFFAASCEDGPLPDLFNACFVTEEDAKSFAEQIRSVLK